MAFHLVLVLLSATGSAFATKYPGTGVISCGDFWTSVTPTGFAGMTTTNTGWNHQRLIRTGNNTFFSPGAMYPAGEEMHLYWGSYVCMYEASTRVINLTDTELSDADKHYMPVFYHNNLAASAPSSNGGEIGVAPWVDDNRDMQLYTASWPTNNGLKCRLQVRGYTLNTANLNNQLIYELQVTNTGNADFNCDGFIDMPNHRIDGLTLECQNGGGVGGVFSNTNNGGRSYSGGWVESRLCGYDATPDAEGNPWAIGFTFHTNIKPDTLTTDPLTHANAWFDGERSIGFRKAWMIPWDIFDGNVFLAVKRGTIEDGPAAADKKTLYDTHAIGQGPQRGWYSTYVHGVKGISGGQKTFLQSMGVFCQDGGRTRTAEPFEAMHPDPNHFSVSDTTRYTVGDPLSWVDVVKPEAERGRLNGAVNYRGDWLQNWERNFPQTPEPKIPAADEWLAGGTSREYYDFDTEYLSCVGPFALEVGETITFVWTQFAGHRLQGARQAVKTAREAYANNFELPKPPPMPDMKISSYWTADNKMKIRLVWDDRAETAADFGGYKIYRVTVYLLVDYSQLGIRFMDAQHLQGPEAIGMTDDQLVAAYAAPNNPNSNVDPRRVRKRNGSPAGPWKLQAYIAKDQLGSYANTSEDAGTYAYEWCDTSEEVNIGYSYYYYVAAFDDESGTLGGVAYDHLESGKDNWNGRSGEWQGYYHFAPGSTDWPTYSLPGQKDLGAPFYNQLPREPSTLPQPQNENKIRVKPNPYKVQARHDMDFEHRVCFYNLVTDLRITILDLSGQIVQVIGHEGSYYNRSVFWDLCNGAGKEVASGMYIWIAEYEGGSQQGYVAILR